MPTLKKNRRKFMTLIEIMIVMFLITIVASMVTYKVKDSIDYGKAFKTHQTIAQLKQVFELSAIKNGTPYATNSENRNKIIERSMLSGKLDKLLKDGWGDPWKNIEVTEDKANKISVKITSEKFDAYIKNHDTIFDDQE
jgi:general secretion pathway protein G